MTVEHDRSRTAGLRSMEATLHMHRRAEAVRAVARGAGRGPAPVAQRAEESALSTWWQRGVSEALWWQITKRFAGIVLRATQTRRMRWFGIGVAALAALRSE